MMSCEGMRMKWDSDWSPVELAMNEIMELMFLTETWFTDIRKKHCSMV